MSDNVIDLTHLSDTSSDALHSNDEDHINENEEERVSLAATAQSRAKLRAALDATSGKDLKHILLRLSASNASFEKVLISEMVEREAESEELVARWEICGHCEEEYDASKTSGGCWTHPGWLRPNYEAFPDHDEDSHGPIDSAENRREYPENFNWTCCNKDGTASGCVKTPHVPQRASKKRRV